MLRTEKVEEDACDVFDERSKEIIFTVWRADGEKDNQLLERAGLIAKCVNEQIRRR